MRIVPRKGPFKILLKRGRDIHGGFVDHSTTDENRRIPRIGKATESGTNDHQKRKPSHVEMVGTPEEVSTTAQAAQNSRDL